ncbi:MAG TPA: peptidoglycan DD-metalloendopeptidase family protein [Chitinophagales bacterium]|nr:peptidoglycan DD-metalloendopeptidase family protein [Chitinophagales bacterium]
MMKPPACTALYCTRCRIAVRVAAYLLLLFVPLFSFSQPSPRQKKEQLQQQMKRLQDEIKNIEAAIKNTSDKKAKGVSEILSLQAKIRSREKLINNMKNQVADLDQTISDTQNDIDNKSQEVEKLKADYAAMLRKSYYNLTLQNEVVFLLSASTFADAVQRYNYLLKVAEYRRMQAKKIETAIGELHDKEADLQEHKEEKLGLLSQQTNQKSELEQEKKEKDKAVADLQEKETNLRKQVEQKNKAAKILNNRIQAIIEEEIRQARKKAEEEARKKNANAPATGKKEVMPLTPAEQALSKDFSANMGKLPWPVERGHIVSQFGKHEHPAIKGVMVENNGVDIKTTPGADAHAIFGGTVVSVFYLPTTQNCVIVKHGEYFTVYSNIETVDVRPNQTVTAHQSLGKLHTDKSDDLTKVHLEIWKGKDKQDPEQWLAGD